MGARLGDRHATARALPRDRSKTGRTKRGARSEPPRQQACACAPSFPGPQTVSAA